MTNTTRYIGLNSRKVRELVSALMDAQDKNANAGVENSIVWLEIEYDETGPSATMQVQGGANTDHVVCGTF